MQQSGRNNLVVDDPSSTAAEDDEVPQLVPNPRSNSFRGLQKQPSVRGGSLQRQPSTRGLQREPSRRVIQRQESGLSSSNHVKRQNSQDLLMGALDDSETMTESSVGTMGSNKAPTSAALPESISWRVANSWKLVEDKLDYLGVEFFLNLFAEHPQAADLFRFGKHVMYLGDDKKKRHENVPKSLRVHARKVRYPVFVRSPAYVVLLHRLWMP